MEHHFKVEDAEKFGIEKAVLLYNLDFWLNKNRANLKHMHQNPKTGQVHFWTYNSSTAFSRLFPYIKERSIRRYLQELEDDGELISGSFNTNKYDQTKWYTRFEFIVKVDDRQPLADRLDNLANGETEFDQPIPDSKPDSKPLIQGEAPASQENLEEKANENTDPDGKWSEDSYGVAVWIPSKAWKLSHPKKVSLAKARSYIKPHFSFEEEMTKLETSHADTDKIVAFIWREKGYYFENAEQMKTQFDLDKTFAARLKGYDRVQVRKAIDKARQMAEKGGFDWKASTVVKVIAEINN